MLKIYLDDIRTPPDSSWLVVRSVEDFKNRILSASVPITDLSFDHDLGDKVPDGYDAAKWFVEYAMDNEQIAQNLKTVIVHSDNTPGRENIAAYFESARAHSVFSDDLVVERRPAMLNNRVLK